MADKDKRVVNLMRLLSDARKYRKDKYDAYWDETHKWFLGNQQLRTGGDSPGTGINNDSFRSDWVTNFMFALIMTEVPILTANTPEIAVTPIMSNMDAQAEEISEILKRIQNANSYNIRLTEKVTNGLLYGRGYTKPVWDGKRFGGLGDITIGVPETRSIYKDKMWCRESNWVFEVRQVDKLSLYRLYPDPRSRKIIDEAFKKVSTSEDTSMPDSYGNTGEIGYHAVDDGETLATTSEAYVWDVATNRDRDKDHVDLVEAWFIDNTNYHDFMKMSDKDYKPGKKEEEKNMGKLGYPTGRHVVFIDGYPYDVLSDKPNPFPCFPYFEYDNYYIPGKLYGEGELEQLKPIQEQYNIRSNQVSDGLNYSIFPITFFDHTSGLDADEIENRPGGFYPCDNVAGIKRFDPKPVSSGAFESLPYLEHLFEAISGIREVMQGQSPGDVRSGYAIEQLQEAGQNRLRMKTRSLEVATVEEARYLTRMIGLFYRPGVHYAFGDDEPLDLRGISPDLFKFEVKAGLSLPNSRVMEEQRYQWMYSEGIVDEQFIVENFNIPNKDEVMARMKPLWDMRKMPPPEQGGMIPMAGPPAAVQGA